MKSKNMISLSVALTFTSLGATGLLLYFGKKMKTIETIHSLFGIIFVAFAIFHIINNWSSLLGYIKERAGGIRKEFWITGALFAFVLIGTAFDFEPFREMAHAGESLLRGERRSRASRVSFEVLSTNTNIKGKALSIMVQKSESVTLPVITIWTEDSTQQFSNALFVPAKTLEVFRGEENNVEEAIAEGEVDEHTFDVAVMPVLNQKQKTVKSNFEGATPQDNFLLETVSPPQENFYVVVEIKSGEKVEVYRAFIDKLNGVFKLKSENGTMITRGLVEIKD